MVSLCRLNLYHNLFEKVPESIAKLKSLEVLNMQDNNLKAIPATIGSLQTLR